LDINEVINGRLEQTSPLTLLEEKNNKEKIK